MRKLKYVLMALLCALGASSQALEITDFNGTWKEIGYRCVGDKAFKARPFPGGKLFKFIDGNYVHRYEPNRPNCSFVESSGLLVTSYAPGSSWLNIFANPKNSVGCYTDTANPLVDDFIANPSKGDLWLRLDDINGATFMIVAGDPSYIDAYCSNPIVERVYGKSQPF